MPSIRIVAAGAALLLLSGLASSAATAQTADREVPGKPLQLLQIAAHSHKTKTKPRAKLLAHASRKHAHRVAAQTTEPQAAAQAAAAPGPANTWPAANATPLIGFGAAQSVPPMASASAEPTPSELVVGGRTVKVASQDEVNEIDLAANDAAAPQGGAVAAVTAPTSDGMAAASPESLTSAPAKKPLAIGSTAWLMQVLAALGGAVAAGSMAWFLIGSTPQRTYG